jgi:ribonucleotide monophosphatase NagD (HAD superfamily)
MLLLVDLDGVVYRGPEPVAGMPELLTRREAAGDIIIYVTNNSRWHRSEYRERLLGMGAPAVP